MNDSNNIEDTYSMYIAVQTEANERNKARTFDALTSAGITKVAVEFDGAGDSGQIETVTAFIGETEAILPSTPVQIEHIAWGSSVSSMSEDPPLQDAIENLCYGFLSQIYDGWENNDGAFGEFTFDVATRTIEFEFNGRYTEHSTDTHTL